jgi:hypothetical protein
MIYSNIVENGTVNASLNSNSTEYQVVTSDVTYSIPGSVSNYDYNEGVNIVAIDPANKTLYLDKDWSNRRALSNQKQIIAKKGSLTRFFNFVRLYPALVNSQPATRVLLAPETDIKDLFLFVGLTGIPSAAGKAYFSLYPQNDYVLNNTATNFQVQKNFDQDEIQREEFHANFTWINGENVYKNWFRWRPTPVSVRNTAINYTVISGGEYSVLPSVSISSKWGTGAVAEVIGCIANVNVLDGGSFDGTPQIEATYPGGSGASFSVGMSGGSISTVTVIDGGYGYNGIPEFSFTGATVISVPSLQCYLGITAVNSANDGYDYIESPTLSLVGGSGTGGSVSAGVTVSNEGRVDCVLLEGEGIGYISDQEVIFSGGGGTGAKAVTKVVNGILSIVMKEHGYGYTSAPTATITGPGSGATAVPVVSLYGNWNYLSFTSTSPNVSLYNLKRNLEYEWQVFNAVRPADQYSNYSQLFKFKIL